MDDVRVTIQESLQVELRVCKCTSMFAFSWKGEPPTYEVKRAGYLVRELVSGCRVCAGLDFRVASQESL